MQLQGQTAVTGIMKVETIPVAAITMVPIIMVLAITIVVVLTSEAATTAIDNGDNMRCPYFGMGSAYLNTRVSF